MKYEVSISDGFGETKVVIVHTALSGFVKAIQSAIEVYCDDEDRIAEIKCREIKESDNGWKEIK
jgi:regulator of PEP synthase PpsR (kinase-PPPase family)